MRYIYLLLIPLFFTGCFSSFPLNLSEEDYNKLSLEEKVRVQETQAKINKEVRIKELELRKKQIQLNHELALKQQENIQILQQNSNEKLIVSIHGGSFKYLNNGYYIAPFEILPYEVKKITVYSNNNYKHHNMWVSFQPEGLYLNIEVPNNYENLDSFVSYDKKIFFESYYKPFIIPRSSRWYKDTKYKVSFQSRYNAQNLKVTLYLQENKRKRRY